METFKLRQNPPQRGRPVVRIHQATWALLDQARRTTGVTMGDIVEQCVAYAFRNGGPVERGLLVMNRPDEPVAFQCPLLADTDDACGDGEEA